MSTEYYLHLNVCNSCGRADKRIFIGQSSAGWCFKLRIHPDYNINSLEDWKKLFLSKDFIIKDKYGDEITPHHMLEIITQRSWHRPFSEGIEQQLREGDSSPYRNVQDFYDTNMAEPGPNNLTRCKIDHVFCVGHGEGTWDLMRNFNGE